MTVRPTVMQMLRRLAWGAALAVAVAAPLRAEEATDCLSEDWNRRIAGCTSIIENPTTKPPERAQAYSLRALSLSLKGQYEDAVRDYDEAIAIIPNFAVALNNRAWAYFKWGRGPQGLGDVEKSLQLNAFSEHTWDTRAHIRQTMGNFTGAFADYERAANLGGERMVKLYQCGLASQRLYQGRMDGRYTEEVRAALRTCAHSKTCDPLPADEECREPTS
ncbi:MAG: tetratricopeptide repeat protein [Hyphomicrobiaceae bacterium]